MTILGKLFRGTKAFVREVRTPESYVSGQRFEDFVEKMFSPEEWELVRKTQNFQSNERRYESKSKEPDFLFMHRKSRMHVNVECKFRSNMLFDGRIEWCKYYQYKRYKQIDNKWKNVYIILGFRGKATKPGQIFRFPISEVKYNAVYPDVIRKYEVDKKHRFRLEFGKLR